MPQRNSYLVDKAFRSFMLSTILSSFAVSLAVTVDSVIVGRLLGAQPLAALSLVTPIAQVYNALTALFNAGGAALVSIYIGKQRMDKAGGVCASALFLSLLAGVIWMLVGAFALNAVSGILTRDAALRPLVEQYLRIMLLSAPVYMLLPGLCVYVRVDNAAKRASMALIVANAVNLVLDIVFIRCFNMGIAGPSLATTCGYVLGFAVAAAHFRSKEKTLVPTRPDMRETPAIIKTGAPIALASVFMTVRVLMTNILVQRFLGAQAMPLMAVCFNVLMLATMFIGGVSQSFQPMGGILIGSEDHLGLRMAAKKAWRTLLVCLGALLALVLLLPGPCMRLFGLAESVENIRALRVFALCIPLYGANYLLMVMHQTLGHTKLATANACMDSLFVVCALMLIGARSPEKLWAAFASGELCVLLTMTALTYPARRKNGGSALLLLPAVNNDSVDFSVRTDLSDIQPGMNAIADFLRAQDAQSVINAVELCCEEMLNVLLGADGKKAKYADVRLRRESERVVLSLKTSGARFDPLTQGGDGIGLLLCNALCREIRYAYIANQNVVTFFIKLPQQADKI